MKYGTAWALALVLGTGCEQKDDGSTDTQGQTAATTDETGPQNPTTGGTTGDGSDTGDSTGATTESTGDTTTGATTASTGDTTTGETGETGDEACAIEELYTPWLNLPANLWAGSLHATCVITAAAPDMPPEFRIDLDCAGTPEVFWILGGMMPDWEPLIGETVEIDLEQDYSDITGVHDTWAAVRHEGRLVYGDVLGQHLIAAGAGAEMFAPFTLEKKFGLCPLREIQPEEDGHGIWCAKRAFAELGVTFEDDPQVLLETGESLEIAAPEGTYRIEVRHADQGVECLDSGDTFAFTIVLNPQ